MGRGPRERHAARERHAVADACSTTDTGTNSDSHSTIVLIARLIELSGPSSAPSSSLSSHRPAFTLSSLPPLSPLASCQLALRVILAAV
jgi:hypothetical protein